MGRRIDDHSFFAGSGNKNSPLPEGCHMKYTDSSTGAGELSEYQDTDPKVKALQEANIAGIKKQPQPPMRRN
jgi:hypothetical protein